MVTLNFIHSGESKTFRVISDSTWVIGNVSWLQFNPTNGSGDTTITITAQPNSGTQRTATITINGNQGDCTDSLTVIQAASTLSPPGTNLFVPSAIIPEKAMHVGTGQLYDSVGTNQAVSGIMAVSPGETYTLSYPLNWMRTEFGVRFVDVNGNPIPRVNPQNGYWPYNVWVTSGDVTQGVSFVFEAPVGAVGVQFELLTTYDLNQIQFYRN
jgi:hypothetical protein